MAGPQGEMKKGEKLLHKFEKNTKLLLIKKKTSFAGPAASHDVGGGKGAMKCNGWPWGISFSNETKCNRYLFEGVSY